MLGTRFVSRPVFFVSAALLWLTLAYTPAVAAGDAAFQQWLQSLWPEAQQLGVSRATFDSATRGLTPDLSLPDLVVPGRKKRPPRGQAEFMLTPAQYLRERNLANLAARGRRLYRKHRATLQQIEQKFGVPPQVVLAIWGRETAFGTYRLPHNALRVLATQGFYGRRKELFRNEFLMALKMLDEGDVRRKDLRSSWGGAMGMTQFLPSEYFKQAVDFDGDGRRDIWHSVPDALASAAKQLSDKGWQPGKGWAYEVRVPKNIDCTIADPDHIMTVRQWIKQGYVPLRKKPSAADLDEKASLLMPAGLHGPAFLILPNYYVIKAYNFSDLYVLFVGNVADRIAGGKSFATPWKKVVQLHTRDLEEMQKRLAELGLYKDKIDGKAGMRTRLALGAYQKANGLHADCWPDSEVLTDMRSRSARN
jgi:lytic murein transglycosylase